MNNGFEPSCSPPRPSSEALPPSSSPTASLVAQAADRRRAELLTAAVSDSGLGIKRQAAVKASGEIGKLADTERQWLQQSKAVNGGTSSTSPKVVAGFNEINRLRNNNKSYDKRKSVNPLAACLTAGRPASKEIIEETRRMLCLDDENAVGNEMRCVKILEDSPMVLEGDQQCNRCVAGTRPSLYSGIKCIVARKSDGTLGRCIPCNMAAATCVHPDGIDSRYNFHQAAKLPSSSRQTTTASPHDVTRMDTSQSSASQGETTTFCSPHTISPELPIDSSPASIGSNASDSSSSQLYRMTAKSTTIGSLQNAQSKVKILQKQLAKQKVETESRDLAWRNRDEDWSRLALDLYSNQLVVTDSPATKSTPELTAEVENLESLLQVPKIRSLFAGEYGNLVSKSIDDILRLVKAVTHASIDDDQPMQLDRLTFENLVDGLSAKPAQIRQADE